MADLINIGINRESLVIKYFMNETQNKYFYLISNYFSLKFITFFYIIKFCVPACDINSPFLKNENCTSSCSIQEIKNEDCKIDNEIYKTQWINNIIYISSSIYTYVNIKTTQNDDLIILISSYENPNERLIYGITKEGTGYFTINNNKYKIFNSSINSKIDMNRFESEIFMAKLSTNTQKEYLISFGHTLNTIEIYDLDKNNIIINTYTDIFYEIISIYQLRGAYTGLNTNDYIIGLNAKDFGGDGTVRNKLCLLKFNIILGSDGNPKINYNNKFLEIGIYYSKYASCYTTTTNYIICFYKNNENKYTMQAFSPSLEEKQKSILADGNENENMYFKYIHFLVK